MPTATLTSKGQVTIPKQVRQRLHLASGDKIEFVLQEDGTALLRPMGHSVRELFGLLSPTDQPAPSLEEIEESIIEDRAADDERIREGGR